jgi:hypothetical protein
MQSFSMVRNQRAAALAGKDLKDEMNRHRENMVALATFSVAITFDIKGKATSSNRSNLKG